MNILANNFQNTLQNYEQASNSLQFFTATLTVTENSHTFTSTTEIYSHIVGIQGFDFSFADGENHEISEMGVQLQAEVSSDKKSITITAVDFLMSKEDQDTISNAATVSIILITAGEECAFSTSNPASRDLAAQSAGAVMTGWHTESENGKNYKVDKWDFCAGYAEASGTDYNISNVAQLVGSGEKTFISEVYTGLIGGYADTENALGSPYFGLEAVDDTQHCVRFEYPVAEVQTVLIAFQNLGDNGTGTEDDSVKRFYVTPLRASVDPRDSRQVNIHWEGTRIETLLDDGINGLIPQEIAGVAALQGGWVGATTASHFPSTLSFLVVAKYETSAHLDLLPNASVPNIVAMHDDTSSSDTTALAGPGKDRVSVSHHNLLGSGTTMLRRSDGHIMAVISSFEDAVEEIMDAITGTTDPDANGPLVNPQIWLLDRDTGRAIGEPLDLVGGSIMGGIYAYLDQNDDTLYIATPIDDVINIVKITADAQAQTGPSYDSADTIALPLANDDFIVAISPDVDGDIWYSTAQGVVGIVNGNGDGTPQTVTLGTDETVNNSFSIASVLQAGVTVQMGAIATNQNLYLVSKNAGAPSIVQSLAYDAGTGAKPGQLAYPPVAGTRKKGWGTGATPTFFGPETGSEYVMITDNADGQLNVLVWKSDGSNDQPIIQQRLFADSEDNGTENSAIGYGNSIIVSSTFGYPYPVPHHFNPNNYPFIGGMARYDIKVENNGDGTESYSAHRIWEHPIRSAAVPKLSIADGKIYTMTRIGESDVASHKDYYAYTVIGFETGLTEYSHDLRLAERLGKTIPGENVLFALDNPLQMASCMSYTSENMPVMWQGTMDGFFRIEMDYKVNLHNTATMLNDIKNHRNE